MPPKYISKVSSIVRTCCSTCCNYNYPPIDPVIDPGFPSAKTNSSPYIPVVKPFYMYTVHNIFSLHPPFYSLVGSLEFFFIFFHILGTIIPTDWYFSFAIQKSVGSGLPGFHGRLHRAETGGGGSPRRRRHRFLHGARPRSRGRMPWRSLGTSKNRIPQLVGGLEPWNFMTFHILGISSSQLTFIFFRGVETSNQIVICWSALILSRHWFVSWCCVVLPCCWWFNQFYYQFYSVKTPMHRFLFSSDPTFLLTMSTMFFMVRSL